MERWTCVSTSCHFLSGCVSSGPSLIIWCLFMSPAAIWCLFCHFVSLRCHRTSLQLLCISHSNEVCPFRLFVFESVWCCSRTADHQHRKKSSLQSDVCVLKSRHLISAFADISLLHPGCFFLGGMRGVGGLRRACPANDFLSAICLSLLHPANFPSSLSCLDGSHTAVWPERRLWSRAFSTLLSSPTSGVF